MWSHAHLLSCLHTRKAVCACHLPASFLSLGTGGGNGPEMEQVDPRGGYAHTVINVRCGSNRVATALALISAGFNHSVDFFPDAKH